MQMLQLPASFVETVLTIWPEDGQAWSDGLPALVNRCCQLWGLEPVALLPHLSMNCLLSVVRQSDRSPAVLKLCKEDGYETDALRCLQGTSTVDLFEHEERLGALLLQQVRPGTLLRELHREDDAQATTIAAKLMAQLSGTTPDLEFPDLGRVMRANLERGLGDSVTSPRIPPALELLDWLESTTSSRVLLHGDLHHDNIILDRNRGWLCIDPKGLLGDPAYEAARLLCNPLGEFEQQPMSLPMMTRRVEAIVAITGFERERVAAWGLLDCLSLASWSQTTGGEMTSHTLDCAELLQSWLTCDLSSS